MTLKTLKLVKSFKLLDDHGTEIVTHIHAHMHKLYVHLRGNIIFLLGQSVKRRKTIL